MTATDEMTCAELVELVTDYLEGALPPVDGARFEAHVASCADCDAHLEQMRRTIGLLGRIRAEMLSPDAQASLLAAFRGWRTAESRT